MNSQIGQQRGGYLVIAIPGGGDSQEPLPQWTLRHFETKEEALEAAERFVEQQEGFEAFVVAAEAYFYNSFKSKK